MNAPHGLRRSPAATVILADGRLHLLTPPKSLLTLHGEDATTAMEVLSDATDRPLEPPPAGTRAERVFGALAEHGVLVPEAEPPAQPGQESRLRVVYGITGAVDALHAPWYLDALRRAGNIEIRLVLTDAATRFVRPEGLSWLSGSPWVDGLFEPGSVNHVQLGEWADVVVVNPACAEFCCRLAAGGYSDLLAATISATPTPVVLVPAMNRRMWERRAVQRAVESLREEGFLLVLPALGWEVATPSAPSGFGAAGVGAERLVSLLRLVAARGGELAPSRSAEGTEG